MTLPYPPPFMDIKTLAEHVPMTDTTIEAHVKMGIFPAPCAVQGGKRIWRWKDVERHFAKGGGQVGSADDKAEAIKNATRKAVENA